eukprot:RCo033460
MSFTSLHFRMQPSPPPTPRCLWLFVAFHRRVSFGCTHTRTCYHTRIDTIETAGLWTENRERSGPRLGTSSASQLSPQGSGRGSANFVHSLPLVFSALLFFWTTPQLDLGCRASSPNFVVPSKWACLWHAGTAEEPPLSWGFHSVSGISWIRGGVYVLLVGFSALFIRVYAVPFRAIPLHNSPTIQPCTIFFAPVISFTVECHAEKVLARRSTSSTSPSLQLWWGFGPPVGLGYSCVFCILSTSQPLSLSSGRGPAQCLCLCLSFFYIIRVLCVCERICGPLTPAFSVLTLILYSGPSCCQLRPISLSRGSWCVVSVAWHGTVLLLRSHLALFFTISIWREKLLRCRQI